MAAAIWMIQYDLDPAQAEEYLEWFNEVHIPEKLKRPGYNWAAHYRFQSDDENTKNTYVALFGGSDSRVFYNPSPAQIKPRQTPETRKMMGFRSNSSLYILSEEWSTAKCETDEIINPEISAEKISLGCFNSLNNDQDLNAWLIQDYLKQSSDNITSRKYLASTGPAHHVLIQENEQAKNPPLLIPAKAVSEWSDQVADQIVFPDRPPTIAERVWPA